MQYIQTKLVPQWFTLDSSAEYTWRREKKEYIQTTLDEYL